MKHPPSDREQNCLSECADELPSEAEAAVSMQAPLLTACFQGSVTGRQTKTEEK